jgi:polysaccharide deacetylase 2 family uncharacterized protein YibQ
VPRIARRASRASPGPRRWFLLLLIAQLTVVSCHKKAPTKTELRVVTHELVAAAQSITEHKGAVDIRPELEPSGSGEVATDHIYITLADPSQKAALEKALDEAAQRHGLERTHFTVAAGVTRFDYERAGRRTHAIHIITPAPEQPVTKAKAEGAGGQLAIILDDLGYERAPADALLALPFRLTISVLPRLPFSAEIAEEAYRRGDQVLLHLPMASTNDQARPEAIELRPGMNPEEVAQALSTMLDTVPHAVGANNHQGSLATTDPLLMAALMPALRQRGLFFIDSRTTAQTVAYDTAERMGVRAAYRNVFLDDTPTREAVLAQLALAERKAKHEGWAIAIGHPHRATLAALEEGLPQLQKRGVLLVFASDLAR